jgi:SAM-dependent methyltransferase
MSVAAFYDGVAAAYQEHAEFYGWLAAALIERLPPPLRYRRILEVGAGSGFATRELRARFPEAGLVALEPSHAMRDLGRAAVPEALWRSERLAELEPEEDFDLVFASASAHWLDAGEWARLLAARGHATLALSLPATALESGASLPAGNVLVARLLLGRRPSARWSADVRARMRALCTAPGAVTSSVALDEPFECAADLAAALYARGALLALFGGAAEEARAAIARAEVGGPIAFRWPFTLLVASPCDRPS